MTAIVPAAGCGARTGLNQNKILVPLCGQPLLSWTLRALIAAATPLSTLGLQINHILIAARPEEFALLRPLIAFDARIALVEGGATRQESVGNAARAANSDFLLVHDAARPLLSPELVVRVAQAALETGGAIAALPASDTVKVVREYSLAPVGGSPVIGSTLARETVWLAQTPQIFRRESYLQALESAERENFAGTDCASLLERIGADVALVEGEIENFKVTFAADIERATAILSGRENALN